MTGSPVETVRIFIVDDEEANIQLLQRILERVGFTNVRSFRDGNEMLAAMDGDAPDLVVLDLHMPTIDGFAVLEAMRAKLDEDEYLPVIVLTADAGRETRSRALAGGANDFLVKPFDVDEVRLRVRNLAQTRLLARTLRDRNIDLAAEVAAHVRDSERERQRQMDARARITQIIEAVEFSPVFQPIVTLTAGRVVGYEALTRFADGTRPDLVFAEAARIGLGTDLEAACLSAALATSARSLPRHGWLSVNVSPTLVLDTERLGRLLAAARLPIVLEITEHVPIADYAAIRSAIASLHIVRSAIDDAGAGFSSFRHILELRPHFVKLDVGLVHTIEDDPARQALVSGMAYFATRTGCELIAEGIETTAERDTLRSLDVGLGQGYLLGRPAAVEASPPTSEGAVLSGDRAARPAVRPARPLVTTPRGAREP